MGTCNIAIYGRLSYMCHVTGNVNIRWSFEKSKIYELLLAAPRLTTCITVTCGHSQSSYTYKWRILVAKCFSSNKLCVVPLPICMRWSASREKNVHNQRLRSAKILPVPWYFYHHRYFISYILTGVMYRREYE